MPEPRDYYAYAVNSDGTLSLPREFNVPNSRPSVEGEIITVYGLGFGAVAGGPQAGVPVGSTESPVLSDRKTVFFGALALGTGTPQEAEYVGLALDSAPNPPQLAPGLVGLYQIRVQVPFGSPKGDVPLRVQLDSSASEFGYVAVE